MIRQRTNLFHSDPRVMAGTTLHISDNDDPGQREARFLWH
jgi:hypothetical protein